MQLQTHLLALRRSVLRILLVFAGLLLFLVVAWWGAHFLTRDLPPTDDLDLRVGEVRVSDQDNAFFILTQLNMETLYSDPALAQARLSDVTVRKYLDNPAEWDQANVDKLLQSNQPALQIWDTATALPAFQHPDYVSQASICSLETDRTNYGQWLNMARLNELHVLDLAQKAQYDPALVRALAQVKLGRTIITSQAPLIEHLVGASIERGGLKTLAEIINSTSNISNTQLTLVRQALDQVRNQPSNLATALKIEYQYSSNCGDLSPESVSQDDSGGGPFLGIEVGNQPLLRLMLENRYFYQPNRTQLQIATAFRTALKEWESGLTAIPADTTINAESPSLISLLRSNSLGQQLINNLYINLDSVTAREQTREFQLRAIQILSAIKEYEANGQSLQALTDLVPTYFSVVPADPFGGEPIGFDPEERVLYSSAEGQTDDPLVYELKF